MKQVYWDAGVFTALFGKEAGRFEICQRIEKAARDGEIEIYTSTVSFVECIKIKGELRRLKKEDESFIQRYFMHKFIRTINCDRLIAESARNLVWQFPHLAPKDSIHLASAISQRLKVVHSYDGDFLKLSGLIGSDPITICIPEYEEKPVPPKPPETPALI